MEWWWGHRLQDSRWMPARLLLGGPSDLLHSRPNTIYSSIYPARWSRNFFGFPTRKNMNVSHPIPPLSRHPNWRRSQTRPIPTNYVAWLVDKIWSEWRVDWEWGMGPWARQNLCDFNRKLYSRLPNRSKSDWNELTAFPTIISIPPTALTASCTQRAQSASTPASYDIVRWSESHYERLFPPPAAFNLRIYPLSPLHLLTIAYVNPTIFTNP